MQTKVKHNYA